MGLSSASRRFKSLRLKRERMPIGNILDTTAAHTDYQSPTAEATPGVHSPTFPEPVHYGTVRSSSMDAKRSFDPNGGSHLQEQQCPPVLTSLPSDVDGRIALAGTATQGDLVVYRLNSWKMLIKQFSDYFEAILSAENSTRKALEKAMKDFHVPLKGDHCFAGIERMGIQQLIMNLGEVHRMYTTQHATTAQDIEKQTLPRLDSLRLEVKDSLKVYTEHVEPIYRKLRKQAKEVEEYKEKLVHAVEAYKKRHRAQDAWLIQQKIRRELTKQAELENALFSAVQSERARLSRWEVALTGRLRDTVAAAMTRESTANKNMHDSIATFMNYLEKFDPSSETQAFDIHFGPVLQSPMGLTGHSALPDYDYMYRDSEPTTVLLEGALEREKGMIRKFQPAYAVLTVQGYLHCFSEQGNLLEKNPDMTFNLSDCSVTPLDDTRMFQIAISDKKLGRSKYAFRASDPAYVEHWINALSSVAVRASTPENHVIGGTLRDADAAIAASAAAAHSAPNTLPTAAGVTVAELAARNAREDALSQASSLADRKVVSGPESPSVAAAAAAATGAAPISPVVQGTASSVVTPMEGEKFYAARDFASESIVAGDRSSTFSAARTADGGGGGIAIDEKIASASAAANNRETLPVYQKRSLQEHEKSSNDHSPVVEPAEPAAVSADA
ncbi:hypothetical protein J3B02_001727 [Coemansia erecta]|uniref:PH domain-containing protein n=1 Tax=Coemansia asiatica TaxID=1052880 RepID=A0A9W7XHA5_9FUNG|nr:hypothetical protein LPJ64_005314 [Coemansia asiatica]KAJ2856226.1 hypothetical protein J3B02_001727 [Coemansia erecta]KAJ2875276.1 hypothetical protein FB639_004016 [Coemansia asiatica]